MSGPWEKYQQTAPSEEAAGPWTKYGSPEAAPVNDGTVGPTIARGGAALTPQQQFDALPTWQKPLQAADDLVRLAANGLTFGYGDKIAGYLSGQGTEQERATTQDARDRAGSAGLATEIGSSVAVPLALGGAGATLIGRGGTAAMTGPLGVGARALMAVPEGVGYGALTAAGNDQDIGTGALYGGLGGFGGSVAGDALSAGVGKLAGVFNKKPSIPTAPEITALKDAAYKRADDAGALYTPQAVAKLKTAVVDAYAKKGFLPTEQSGAAAVLKNIEALEGQNVTFTGLDAIRKQAGGAYNPLNKTNNSLLNSVKDHIDDLIKNPAPGDMLGDAGGVTAAAAKEARDYAQRAFKLDDVENAVKRAELRAASTGSGGNVDNATRQGLRRVMEKGRGFTADETQALTDAVRGTPGQNALRLAGKLSPQGNGLMAALGVGGAMVNPLYGIPALAGLGAKVAADKMTATNVTKLAEVIRAGGSKSATQALPNAVQRLSADSRDAIARILMALTAREGGTP